MAHRFFTPVAFASLSQTEIDNFNTAGLPIGVEVYNTTTKHNVKWDGTVWKNVSQFDEINTLIKSSVSGYMYGSAPVESIVFAQIFDVDTTFPQNVPFSMCRSLVTPSAATTMDILRIDKNTGTETAIGNITFPSTANQVASVSFPAEVTMAIDDIIGIKTRAATNGIANVFLNLVGHSHLPTY